MATSSASSTGLTKNTDFAAELILNKVMNAEYRATSGNTLTLGGRMNASKLDATAHTYNVQAENIAKAKTLADATENALTELLALAKRAQEVNLVENSTNLQRLGKEFQTQFNSLLTTEVESLKVLNGTKAASLGLGSGEVTLGVSGTADAGIAALSSALSSLAAGSSASNWDTVIDQLTTSLGVEGSKAALINNRYDVLNDLAASYKDASDAQAVTAGGSSTSLLGELL